MVLYESKYVLVLILKKTLEHFFCNYFRGRVRNLPTITVIDSQ